MDLGKSHFSGCPCRPCIFSRDSSDHYLCIYIKYSSTCLDFDWLLILQWKLSLSLSLSLYIYIYIYIYVCIYVCNVFMYIYVFMYVSTTHVRIWQIFCYSPIILHDDIIEISSPFWYSLQFFLFDCFFWMNHFPNARFF
jgi:hypothetical protein